MQYWPSEKDAFVEEKALIAKYGRKDLGTGCLRNMSDGGVGGALTGKALEKMKVSRKNYRPSFDTKMKISKALKGKPKTPAHRLKIALISAPQGDV